MFGTTIQSMETVEVRRVRFAAFGATWVALLVPSGDSLLVVVKPEGENVARVATTVPLRSVTDDEDVEYVLGTPEVGVTLSDLAMELDVEGFDWLAHSQAGFTFVVSEELSQGRGVEVDFAGDTPKGMLSSLANVFKDR